MNWSSVARMAVLDNDEEVGDRERSGEVEEDSVACSVDDRGGGMANLGSAAVDDVLRAL